jgi:thiol-disulfide isomerase/thioredoxin
MKIKVIVALLLAVVAAQADEYVPVLRVGSDTFTNVTVTRVTASDIYFLSPSGLGNAKIKELDPQLQQHFHFNRSKAGALEQAQAQANDQYRAQLATQPTVKPPDMSKSAEPDVPEGLKVGQRLPDFNESDRQGNPLSISGARGKVVLVDFWATWCGPCCREMPNVIATYQKYHEAGFDVIGVSLDKDSSQLASYTAAQGMDWPQYFDGKGWDNKLVKPYAIKFIPMNYLLDRNGVIIGKELRGPFLDAAVSDAVASK